MSCSAWVPFGLLALLTFRVADLWRTGELDPVTMAMLPVAAVMVWWLVRQPGSCSSDGCSVPTDAVERRGDAVAVDGSPPEGEPADR